MVNLQLLNKNEIILAMMVHLSISQSLLSLRMVNAFKTVLWVSRPVRQRHDARSGDQLVTFWRYTQLGCCNLIKSYSEVSSTFLASYYCLKMSWESLQTHHCLPIPPSKVRWINPLTFVEKNLEFLICTLKQYLHRQDHCYSVLQYIWVGLVPFLEGSRLVRQREKVTSWSPFGGMLS
jgi:hypothetical protein